MELELYLITLSRTRRGYLSVEKAIEEGGEEALKGDQERRDEAPGGEVSQVFVVRRGHHLEAVGDPEQRLQHDGRLHTRPATHRAQLEEARPGSRHVGDVLRCKCQERRLLHILFLRTSTPKSDFADKKTNILTSGGDTMFT